MLIENISKYLTLATLVLIIGGILRAYFYYINFNISINEYLKVGETLIIFTDDLLFTAGLFFFSTMVSYTYINQMDIIDSEKPQALNIENLRKTDKSIETLYQEVERFEREWEQKIEKVKELPENEKELKVSEMQSIFAKEKEVFEEKVRTLRDLRRRARLKKRNRKTGLVIGAIFLFVIFLIWLQDYLNLENTIFGSSITFFNIVVTLNIMYFLLNSIFSKLITTKKLEFSINVCFQIVSFWILMSYTGHLFAKGIKIMKAERIVTFNYKSNLIKTNQDTIAVGKTENWLFLYIKSEDKTMALPLSNIEEIYNEPVKNVKSKSVKKE